MKNNYNPRFPHSMFNKAMASRIRFLTKIRANFRRLKWTAVVCFLLLVLSSQHASASCSLPRPGNIRITKWTSCDATLAWDAVPGAAYYKVEYRFKNATEFTIVSAQLTTTCYTFTNLVADSSYKFGVAAFCPVNGSSGYTQMGRRLRPVAIPESLTASNPGDDSIRLSWVAHCPTSSFNIRFHISSSLNWTVISNVHSTSYTVRGLLPNTTYEFRVQGKNGIDTSLWCPYITVKSAPHFKPNILLFVLDDSRYDPFQPNGGPAWFNTPSINRIAGEGINFVYSFPTTSQCAPSRMSIYSGLYANHHGAINNDAKHYDDITLVQQILHDDGYYTGFVGKYGQLQGDPQGFDWWAVSSGNIFNNPTYTINGKDTSISGHITDVYQSLALTFLNSVPARKKLCLMFFTRVPHGPTTPRDPDLNLYKSETMPFPDNFYRYTVNYPSSLYTNNSHHKWQYTAAQTDSLKLLDFQCLYGAEVNMTAFLNWLTAKGILDSTLIFFTSDNGYLEGEHLLDGKQLAQEESIRIPMFIRYPRWFAPGQVNRSIMALNIDIAPTLLNAAGIPDTAGMDGVSLLQLYWDSVHRKYFYYQFAGEGTTPAIRAVRTSQYKYVKTCCTEVTEEFYDLIADPEENINQINKSSYASLIASYRIVLDSIKNALGDTDLILSNCYLSNPEYSRNEDEEADEFNLRNLEVYPNPASQYFMIRFADEEREDIEVLITNVLNEKVYYKKLADTNSIDMPVNATGWTRGFYMVTIKKGNRVFNTKVTVQ